jgi:hypothetical protein
MIPRTILSCLGGRRISEYPPPKSAEGGATIVESCGDKREPIPKTDATGESHVSKNETWGTPCLAVAIEIKITPGPPVPRKILITQLSSA